MVLNNIEKLIEKYHNAETSLQEEAQLKAYFLSGNVAPHLEHYRPMFQYFSQSKTEQYTKDVPLKSNKAKLYQWISVAAVAVLMLGLVVPNFMGPTEEEKQEALMAYNQTVEAFSLISIGMNEGKQQLSSLVLVSDNLNEGIEEAGRLSEFTETTNKIFKNK
ncbi:hypothetical protein [Winogradskyella bathintestinalis]|uniref:Anti-sigma factor n=1 Tax=Winogradskyella bathintestinalis TaxID=3035208 RepID=A0ABT7ZTC5_9FLAO|nr:hypothetical protein [Winogradskyella bathintestinalis]MDN3492282.1 hypothetical protein [Winogradskyella bathintestinalis]